MSMRWVFLTLTGLIAWPAAACAAGGGHLDLPVWSVAPFVLLLLTIAILPLVAGAWWHRNRNRALVTAGFAVPTLLYLFYAYWAEGLDTLHPLGHEVKSYFSFILLLGSLYTVAGGVVITGDLEGSPRNNTILLACGAVLANLIGTTGASVLLIRPFLRINRQRQHATHLPIFFIFTVSNLGGLLTPLGDPPLFLGFLNGVPFFWTLALWPEWLLANGIVLAIFLIWDARAWRREPPKAVEQSGRPVEPLRIKGWLNAFLLAGILAGVVLQPFLPPPAGELTGALLMLVMGLLSLGLTPRALRVANGFTWGPMLEVTILFAGIFITMVPALELLGAHGQDLGLTQPWHYFWLTGGLSAFLDNAPTYLTLATVAAGSGDFGVLVRGEAPGLDGPMVLRAISCGSVFLGALTYIGNGPNFMVKAIADEAGYPTPSFFGYLAYSCVILLPVFLLVTVIFFRPF